MMFLTWLLSPIGKWVGAAIAVAIFVGGFYWSARRDGANALRAQQMQDGQRRTNNALEADARTRDRLNRGGLLEDDGHRRD